MVTILETNKKEVEVIFTGLKMTSKYNVYAIEFLTDENDIFYLMAEYNGSLIDMKAKYSRDKKIFNYLFDNFFGEIAKEIIRLQNEKKGEQEKEKAA